MEKRSANKADYIEAHVLSRRKSPRNSTKDAFSPNFYYLTKTFNDFLLKFLNLHVIIKLWTGWHALLRTSPELL